MKLLGFLVAILYAPIVLFAYAWRWILGLFLGKDWFL